MVKINIARIEEPDHFIKIGIKDGKVMRVDWQELPVGLFTSEEIQQKVCNFLFDAQVFMEKK